MAFHLPKAKQSDAEWIQCNVIRITGDYPKLRYEVQDPEPDDHGTIQTYKANASSLILIPDDSAGLPPLPNGTMVLARYPETTTFYKAEVIATKVKHIFTIYSFFSGMGLVSYGLKEKRRLARKRMLKDGLFLKCDTSAIM